MRFSQRHLWSRNYYRQQLIAMSPWKSKSVEQCCIASGLSILTDRSRTNLEVGLITETYTLILLFFCTDEWHKKTAKAISARKLHFPMSRWSLVKQSITSCWQSSPVFNSYSYWDKVLNSSDIQILSGAPSLLSISFATGLCCVCSSCC